MTSDELKRILLIMGAKDPAIKMSVRQIMNRMDSNEDLSSIFASVSASRVPPGFDHKEWEDTKSRVLERTRKEFVWLGWGHADWGTPIERDALQELSHEGKVEFHMGKGYIATDSFLARNADSDIPKTVKRYVDEHLEQGNDEGKAWALAWSRYCKFKNPGSPRCKQDNYFSGRDSCSIEARVAALWLRRAYSVALPSRKRQRLIDGLQQLVRKGITPFPKDDPQRFLGQIAKNLRSDVQDLLGEGPTLSTESAHDVIRTILHEASATLNGKILEKAAVEMGVNPELLGREVVGRLGSIVDDMVNGFAKDAARGSLRGQKQAIRLFQRNLGMEEWEAQQLLDVVVSGIKIEVGLAPDQVDLLLTSYLD